MSADLDRRAQASEPNLLWLSLDLKMEVLRPQIDVSGALDQYVLGIERDVLCSHPTVGDLELRDAAAHRGFFIRLGQQEPQAFGDIDSGQLRQGRGDLPIGQNSGKTAIGIGHYLVHRVTVPVN